MGKRLQQARPGVILAKPLGKSLERWNAAAGVNKGKNITSANQRSS